MPSPWVINRIKSNPDKLEKVLKRYLMQERAKYYLNGVVSVLRPDEVCIDCGANIGTISEILAKTGAQVHSFEPDPVAFKELKTRLGKAKNVTLHNAAVGAENGELSLFRVDAFGDDPINKTVSSTLVATAGKSYVDAGITVKVQSIVTFIRDLLKKHDKIAVLKMDIEGFEVEVLNALIGADLMGNIQNTLVETHLRKRPEAREDFKRFRKLSSENPQWRLNLDWI